MRRQLEAHGGTRIRGQRGSLRACNRKPVNCGTFVVAAYDFHTSQAFVTYVLVPCAVGVFRWTVSGVKPRCRNRAITPRKSLFKGVSCIGRITAASDAGHIAMCTMPTARRF